jgi:hypothetical protein
LQNKETIGKHLFKLQQHLLYSSPNENTIAINEAKRQKQNKKFRYNVKKKGVRITFYLLGYHKGLILFTLEDSNFMVMSCRRKRCNFLGFSRKELYIFFLDYNQISILSTDFSYDFRVPNFRVINPVRDLLEHADTQTVGRTNVYDVKNGRLLRLCEES